MNKSYQLLSDTGLSRGMGCDEAPILTVSEQKGMAAKHTCCIITGADELNEMGVEKWWNDICVVENRRIPEKNLSRPCFSHHEIHTKRPRCELETSTVADK